MSGLLARFRNGPLTRWGAYWRQLGRDYVDVFRDTAQESRRRPVKASIYLLGTSALVYAWNTSPTERQFSDQLTSADERLRLLAPHQRSPAADQHARHLRQLQADGRLRVLNLGALSLLWELPYPAGTALHAAQCAHVLPTYLSFHERVLDAGAFGRWWWLRWSMRDYDVNEELFEEAGERGNSQMFGSVIT